MRNAPFIALSESRRTVRGGKRGEGPAGSPGLSAIPRPAHEMARRFSLLRKLSGFRLGRSQTRWYRKAHLFVLEMADAINFARCHGVAVKWKIISMNIQFANELRSLFPRLGEIIVRAPVYATKDQIDAHVRSREQWIRKHQKDLDQRLQTLPQVEPLSMEEVLALADRAL